MSASDDQSSRSDDSTEHSESQSEEGEEENEEYDDFTNEGVTTAKPPEGLALGKVMLATDILDYVDQLMESNQISSERGMRLKRKYTALVESIETSRAAENTLLMKVKELQTKLESDQRILEKMEGFPESYSTDTSRLRQIKLQHENELMEAEVVEEKLKREIERLEEECEQLNFEYNHMPKSQEEKDKMEKIKKDMEMLKEDISEQNGNVIKLEEAKKQKDFKIQLLQEEIDQLRESQIVPIKDQLAGLALAPLNTPREMDKLRKAINETNERIKGSNDESNELLEEILRQTRQVKTLTDELSVAKEHLDNERRKIDAKQVGSESLAKNIVTGKEHESTLIEEEASLDLQKKLKLQEHKQLQESMAAKNREKDREMKQLKRADIQLRTALSSLDQQEKILEPFTFRAEEAKEAHRKQEEAIEIVRQEVDELRKYVAQNTSYEQVQQRSLYMHIDKEKYFRDLAKKNQETLRIIGKDIIAVTRQRDVRSRDYYKALRESHGVDYDQKILRNQFEDQQKKLRDLDNSLREFADAYNVVKTERNKAYSQIQTFFQLSAEMREKIKVLQNESEILQNAVDSKSKVLARAQLALISKSQDRDVQHQDLSKARLQQEETQNSLEQQRETLHKLIQQINAMEHSLNKLRLGYEHSVQVRNDMGLQLIERNEEVCVFHEKLNIQDSVCRKGNMELMEKEEEIKFLNMEIAKLNRELDILKNVLPDKESLEREVIRCSNQLSNTRELIKYLEDRVTDASNPERLRLLKGEDPTCSELREKLEKLQFRLTDQEQRVLEKELLVEQVMRLVDRQKKRVEARQHTTLQVGNKVNSYQSKLRNGTKKMMALVSELSLQQAMALRLQQEVTDKETQLEQAYSRLDSGEAPDEESAKEWMKMVRAAEMRNSRDFEKQQLPEESGRELPNGIYTMAEPRPNAYIPESEMELPLPKPYGARAPFKPSQQGANMRHIRKPEPPLIDI